MMHEATEGLSPLSSMIARMQPGQSLWFGISSDDDVSYSLGVMSKTGEQCRRDDITWIEPENETDARELIEAMEAAGSLTGTFCGVWMLADQTPRRTVFDEVAERLRPAYSDAQDPGDHVWCFQPFDEFDIPAYFKSVALLAYAPRSFALLRRYLDRYDEFRDGFVQQALSQLRASAALDEEQRRLIERFDDLVEWGAVMEGRILVLFSDQEVARFADQHYRGTRRYSENDVMADDVMA